MPNFGLKWFIISGEKRFFERVFLLSRHLPLEKGVALHLKFGPVVPEKKMEM